MNSDKTDYCIIFDTNTLFQSYDKKSDFTKFSFNSTFQNVIDMINQLDIYSNVRLIIPSVLWEEMKKQIIESHDEQIVNFKNTIKRRIFPEYTVSFNSDINYPEYIEKMIEEYKTTLSSGINLVCDIPIATNQCFDSIVKRAFNKNPPFEGKDKKSDKGFKDALLWESILEFAATNRNSEIIYYSKDNAFDEYLLAEFKEVIENSQIYICKDEQSVKNQLQIWAKEIDEYSYQPINDYDENIEIVDWLQSDDFIAQLINQDFDIFEKSHLLVNTTVNLISIDNIELINETDIRSDYSVDAILKIDYRFKDGGTTSEKIKIILQINCIDGTIFTVEDIYYMDEYENESDQ